MCSLFPDPRLEVAGGMSSRGQCPISPNRIAPALWPGLCGLFSSISCLRFLMQLGDIPAHLAAACLCPAVGPWGLVRAGLCSEREGLV